MQAGRVHHRWLDVEQGAREGCVACHAAGRGVDNAEKVLAGRATKHVSPNEAEVEGCTDGVRENMKAQESGIVEGARGCMALHIQGGHGSVGAMMLESGDDIVGGKSEHGQRATR